MVASGGCTRFERQGRRPLRVEGAGAETGRRGRSWKYRVESVVEERTGEEISPGEGSVGERWCSGTKQRKEESLARKTTHRNGQTRGRRRGSHVEESPSVH